jgi:hypothetical protein
VRALFVVFLLLAATVAATPAGGGRQADLLVRHGESIGKLKLGMTLPQVRELLGPERTVNKREKRGTRGYVYLELDWDYAWWTVGFMRAAGGKYRAVSIGTIQKGQRTSEGFGVGSTATEVARRLDIRCRAVFPRRGEPARAASDWRDLVLQLECVYGLPGGRQTVFMLDNKRTGYNDPRSGIVQVEVRDPLFYRGWPVKLCPIYGIDVYC